MNPVTVKVEYCGSWGYGNRFEELKLRINNGVPEALVEGVVGRRSSYEVTINGKLVFSKLERNSFPDMDEIVNNVIKVTKNEEADVIQQTEPQWCVLLWFWWGRMFPLYDDWLVNRIFLSVQSDAGSVKH